MAAPVQFSVEEKALVQWAFFHTQPPQYREFRLNACIYLRKLKSMVFVWFLFVFLFFK